MDDPADLRLGAGAIERSRTRLVHGAQGLARAILQRAGAIDHAIDTVEKRTPRRRLGRARDVEPDMAQRDGARGRGA
jgi:hypothetical protein